MMRRTLGQDPCPDYHLFLTAVLPVTGATAETGLLATRATGSPAPGVAIVANEATTAGTGSYQQERQQRQDFYRQD
jgi:hypothetical protein